MKLLRVIGHQVGFPEMDKLIGGIFSYDIIDDDEYPYNINVNGFSWIFEPHQVELIESTVLDAIYEEE